MINPQFWQQKRVFLTGHTGFKGSWLCKILETLGAEVTGYALAPQSPPNLFEICRPNARSVTGDIRDYDALSGALSSFKPQIVVHMAAQPLVLDSYRRPRYTYDVNVMGTVNLLESVRQTDSVKSVLNVTTDKVYLNRERAEGYKEDEKLDGYDPYSNSKSCSELVTSSYIKSFFAPAGIAVSTARSGNVIGGGDFAENRLVPDCARALSESKTILIRNPHSVRPYQHVLDTLFAYLLIAERQYSDISLAGAYNVGPGEKDSATAGVLADMFCAAWGDGARWETVNVENPHEAGLLTLDGEKIKNTLGWQPRWAIEQAVTETAKWYRAYYNDEDFNTVMARQINKFVKYI
jgi:CDP-glucose 4,6-dehydratase